MNLVSYCDSAYIPKMIVMLRSLLRHNPDAFVLVVACDEKVREIIEPERFANRVAVRPLASVEDDRLRAIRHTRSWVEYLWTLTPTVMLYALDFFEDDDIAYVDADLFFVRDLDPLYREIWLAHSAVIPHRWTPRHADRLRPNGIYNVSWNYADRHAKPFLEEWRDSVIQWCGRTNKGQGVGDQGYLDVLQPKYDCHIVQHLGANLAPWSQEQYEYEWRDGNLWIDGKDPLLFYHFHELLHSKDGSILRRTGYPIHPMVVKHVYEPYEEEIRKVIYDFGLA